MAEDEDEIEARELLYEREFDCQVCGEQCGSVEDREPEHDPRPWVMLGGYCVFPGEEENGVGFTPSVWEDDDGPWMTDWHAVHRECLDIFLDGMLASRRFRPGPDGD